MAIHVQADPRFERDGADLHAEVNLSFAQAALGTRVKIPTLTGEEEVDVEPGTQPGDVVSLRGRGLPRMRERGQGDLHVHFALIVPRRLTIEQQARLRAFAELDDSAPAEEPPRPRSGLFGRRKKR